jgi:curli biogenesis system outer membrane secretion channel CsgG
MVYVFIIAGCTTYMEDRHPPVKPRYGSPVRLKPVVAVTDFDNRANFSGKWNLGEGMAEVLTTQLLETDHFIVLERDQIETLLDEIIRQGRNLFRKEGRVDTGRLRNAQYLISGAITDFTVTGDASGWFGIKQAKARGRGSLARVALNIKVVDVETGEIIAAAQTDGKASSGFFGAEVNYRKLTFGGEAFFRTPLGRATAGAIRKAIGQIERDLPRQYWQPRVAEAGPDMVVINGGENVKVQAGIEFLVRGEGREITDPVTGNVIETVPGRVIGRIRVEQVKARSSHARVLEGQAYRGCYLEEAGYRQ